MQNKAKCRYRASICRHIAPSINEDVATHFSKQPNLMSRVLARGEWRKKPNPALDFKRLTEAY